MPVPTNLPHKHHDEINDQGFTVVRNFLTPQEIERYIKASEDLVEYSRAGNWPHVRTRGKQFPPWPKNFSPDIWGVTGLLHPDLGELSYPFHDLYANEKILALVSDILQIDKSEISMELLNMLINPLTDFDLDWHRDTIKPEVTPEQEAEELLENPFAGAQFNLALTNDDCLIVVPGSHKRVRTQEERDKTVDESRRKEHITDQITVNLKPGDIVFYNNNVLHRASYSSKNKRLTLHGSYGNVKYGKARAKGVLQHGVAEWLPRLQPKNEDLEMLKSKLVDLANQFDGVNLGFALDG
ncbi:hypothetical protein CORT_0E05050 [Candida orthopsilosis Co 90-125]|uniref:Phytanoyl-CoA dioxygenase n=1 Tax=Candida orthopsilosis (strain 90-125) TaxID=1136231 RepID=H8X7Z0_CANO9|nr:hypothetical protein CORT_0E05050 [Candida orthopsilosis Co 90-125]CCG24089.1 hypothetical protein CORT_0E05050 [Candida orthopsilosis Co 90-125]